jgi:deoxyribodipyrimidine photolyase
VKVSAARSSANVRKKLDDIEWDGDDEHFHAWCEGRTGYPIVDHAVERRRTLDAYAAARS